MRAGAPPKALKLVSEPTRERETFKYEPSLPTRIKYNVGSDPIPSSQLVSSADTILTALVQLGACQTRTARSLISLFDQSHQYVVAEATPTLPLVPSLRHEDRDEDLWLCGTAIPRQDGVCDHSLCGPDAGDEDGAGSPGQLPLSLVVDLQTDPRFSCKPYCRPGSPARFYAAVPIRTQRGINIGVYCVIDTEPREDWDDARTQVMRNISRSIMVHLDAKRAASNHRRGVRMNSGIASFIEGESTVSGWRSGPNPAAFQDGDRLEGMLNVNQQSAHSGQVDAGTAADQGSGNKAVPPPLGSHLDGNGSAPSLGNVEQQATQATPSTGAQATPMPSVDDRGSENPLTAIFSKAANIIRESMEVEGCLFVDARSTSFGVLRGGSGPNDWSRPHETPSSQSGSDDSTTCPTDKVPTWSEVLGFSTSDASSIDRAKPTHLHESMPEQLISKLLRRYPKGKIFSFDANGELQSSDSSEDDILRTPADAGPTGLPPNPAATSRHRRPWARHREGSAILETFAGARSVAFVPLWDSKKGRWGAACFAYTRAPTRIFTMDGELSYLRGFGMLAMSEVSRLDAQVASKAKSDVLGAISHELRSPLHGVLLGVELLNDTAVSAFQGNILHTIETCGRTLKDTLEHLLDFAKINNYKTRRSNQGTTNARSREPKLIRAGSFETGMTSLYANSSVDNLAEEVVESVFAGFNFQYASVAQLQRHETGSLPTNVHDNRRLDSLHAINEFGPTLTEQGNIQTDFGKVSLFLDIDPTCASWVFRIQPGAVRRVLMNLFGNSLKYTSQGTITVRLRQEASSRKRPAKEQTLKITVSDTGKGISDDFLRNDLFKPFLQEDHLSPGTGLGLSIVKQITSQLGGTVSVESLVGAGTTVSVSLPMGMAITADAGACADMPVDDRDFHKHVAELKGLRVRLVGFDSNHSQTSFEPKYGLAESVCRDWLRMEVISQAQHEEMAADLLLVAEHILPQFQKLSRSDAPVVVVCANALAAYNHSTVAERRSTERVFEFISQPTGPRKLAKMFGIALGRWIDLQALPVAVTLPSPKPNMEHRVSSNSSFSIPTPDTVSPTGDQNPMPSVFEDLGELGENTPAPADTNVVSSQPPNLPWEAAERRTLSHSATCDIGQPRVIVKEELKFLLVDDNHINLKILASHAKKLGRQYETATNGQEAVDAYLAGPEQYSCIFMDISMPVMDGFAAMRSIRSFEREKGLKAVTIFALTGLASTTAQQEALESGVDLFLTKPVLLKELGHILMTRQLL